MGRVVDSYVKSGTTYLAGRAYSYDPSGRQVNVSLCTVDNCGVGWFYGVGNTYDVNGSVYSQSMVTAGTTNFTLNYVYNAFQQLTSLTSTWNDATHPGTLMAGTVYSPLGGENSALLGNGATETFAYDKRDRLGCGSVTKNSSTLYSVSLSNANGQCSSFSGSGYSGNGNVVTSQDSVNGNWTYSYDDFNRLVSASASSGPQNGTVMTWTYDRFGNRWTQSQTGVSPQSYTFTGHNNRIDGASYDAAGNVLAANGNSYAYDDENRVVSVALILGGSASYSYDADGRRIRKVAGGVIEEYVNDGAGHQFGTMQSNGSMKRMEIYAGARHFATYDVGTNATYFVHGDWQGTERMRSNVSGVSYQTCSSLPFGDSQTCSGTDISPMHFTGKPRDTETNLDYFGARYYNSSMARWMSPDWDARPVTVPYAQFGDPQSLNLYAYVTDNPVSRQDADGHLMTINQLYSWHSGVQDQMSVVMGVAGDQSQQKLDEQLQNSGAKGQTQQPPTSVNVLGRSIAITYGKGLSSDAELAAGRKIAAAVGLIDANADSLTEAEKKAIGKISSFTIAGPGTYVGATGKGSITLTARYLTESTPAWIGSLFGHEGQHYVNHGRYSGENLWRDEQSAGRMQLGIGNKIGFQSRESRYLEEWIDDKNKAAMQQHMLQGLTY